MQMNHSRALHPTTFPFRLSSSGPTFCFLNHPPGQEPDNLGQPLGPRAPWQYHGSLLLSCWVAFSFCEPVDCSMSFSCVLHYLPEFAQIHVHWMIMVMIPNHLVLCCPLLLLPSIFPSIRGFSNESALRIRWPKYWSFSFSISPSNE